MGNIKSLLKSGNRNAKDAEKGQVAVRPPMSVTIKEPITNFMNYFMWIIMKNAASVTKKQQIVKNAFVTKNQETVQNAAVAKDQQTGQNAVPVTKNQETVQNAASVTKNQQPPSKKQESVPVYKTMNVKLAKKRLSPSVNIIVAIVMFFAVLALLSLKMDSAAALILKIFGLSNYAMVYNPGVFAERSVRFQAFGLIRDDEMFPFNRNDTDATKLRNMLPVKPLPPSSKPHDIQNSKALDTKKVAKKRLRDFVKLFHSDDYDTLTPGMLWFCLQFDAPAVLMPPFCPKALTDASEISDLSLIYPQPKKGPSFDILEPVAVRVYKSGLEESPLVTNEAKVWKKNVDGNSEITPWVAKPYQSIIKTTMENSLNDLIVRNKRQVSYDDGNNLQEPSPLPGNDQSVENQQESPLAAILNWLPAPPFFSQPELRDFEIEESRMVKTGDDERSVEEDQPAFVNEIHEANILEQSPTDYLCDGIGQPCRKSVNEAGDAPSLIRPEPVITQVPVNNLDDPNQPRGYDDPESYTETALFLSITGLLSFAAITVCYAVLSKIRQRRPASDDVENQLPSGEASGNDQQTKEFQHETITTRKINEGDHQILSEESETVAPQMPY